MGPKVAKIPVVGISRLPLGSPETKWHLGVGPMVRYKVYYKGEGGGFPQVRAMVNIMGACLLVVHSCTKCCNYTLINLLFGLCKSMWVSEVFINLPSPILELQHAPLPPKCYEPRNAPQLLTLPLFLPQTHIWIYQGAWECIKDGHKKILGHIRATPTMINDWNWISVTYIFCNDQIILIAKL
jgi:hypothetical protein